MVNRQHNGNLPLCGWNFRWWGEGPSWGRFVGGGRCCPSSTGATNAGQLVQEQLYLVT